ncbi:MAG: hypothetical protein ACJ73V_01560 [Acidimicrobiia bacterium]
MDRQYVGIDFHRRRSVIVRKNAAGEKLGSVRVVNEPLAIAAAVAEAGPSPEVVIEATYGWYWIVDWLRSRARLCIREPVVRAPAAGSRIRLGWMAALDGVLGYLVLTKLSTLPLAGRCRSRGAREQSIVARTSKVALDRRGFHPHGVRLVAGAEPIRYGDPFAQRASAAYLRPIGGLGGYLFAEPRPLRLIFVDVPRNVYHSFCTTPVGTSSSGRHPPTLSFGRPFSSPSPALPSRDANRTGR